MESQSKTPVTDQTFEIDQEGCALRSLTATDENWRSVQQLLPLPLRYVITYTKGAWSIVLIPPGIHGPIFTPFDATPDPPDPLSDPLDPLRSLSDQEAEGIFSFPDKESFSRVILPQSFGGLTVAKTIVESRLSTEPTPLSQVSPVEPVTTHTEDRITLVGGDELIVHGALFGHPPEDGGDVEISIAGAAAASSLVSHLYRIAHCRLSEYDDVLQSAPRMIYNQNDHLIGTIESFEDDLEEANESPHLYQTDFCYIRLEQPIHFQIASDEDPRPWRFYGESDGDGVLYNQKLRMWCRGSHSPPSGVDDRHNGISGFYYYRLCLMSFES
ncbi:hypothetical protein V8E54_004606 [Elaphomyces granulatus]